MDPVGTILCVTVVFISVLPTLGECTKILCLGLDESDGQVVGKLREQILKLEFVKTCTVLMWRSDAENKRVNIEIDISQLERKNIDGIIEFKNRVREIHFAHGVREKEVLIDINYIDYDASEDSE